MVTTPPAPNLTVLLIIVGRRVQERLEAELASLAITQRHLSALGHVAADPGLSYSALARRSSVTVQSIKATLARLEELGAVEREEEERQGRRATLSVTPAGRRLLKNGMQRIERIEAELAASLGDAERAAVLAGLLGIAADTTGSPGTQRRGAGRNI